MQELQQLLTQLNGFNRFLGMVTDLVEYRIQCLQPVNTDSRDSIPVTEAAKKLGVHRSTIHGWESRGLIEIDRTGNKNRVSFTAAERIFNGESVQGQDRRKSGGSEGQQET